MTDYKLMPKQITEEMADAFWEEYYKDRHDDLLMRCYKALYATAPAPQPVEKPDVTQLVEALKAIVEFGCDPESNRGMWALCCATAQRALTAYES